MTAGPVGALVRAFGEYVSARQKLLAMLGCPESNRDPLAEFAERLVAAALSGEVAASRVQRGYDLTTATGERVQVRFLANPAGRWVNGHLVDFGGDCDSYALVVFETHRPIAVLLFQRTTISAVCAALGKRHPAQDLQLQLTQRNYEQLVAEAARFAEIGVTVLPLG